MELSESIARRYWREALEAQVAANLEDEGFQVRRDAIVDKWTADLFATRGDTTIVYEFKTPDWDRRRAEQAKQLRNYVVHRLGGNYRLAWVAPPKPTDIDVEGIECLLLEVISEDLPSGLDALSYATRVDEVADVAIESLSLIPGRIELSGEAVVVVDLSYGSPMGDESEDGLSFSDSYPFNFRLVLDSDLRVSEVIELTVDTSSFYE